MTLNAVANRTEATAPNRLSLSEAMRISKLSRGEIRARVSARRRGRCWADSLTLGEAAYLLCLSRETTRAHLQNGRLEATRRDVADGWAWDIPRESLDALAESLE